MGLTYIAVDHYFCRTNKNLNLDVYGRGNCDLGFLVLEQQRLCIKYFSYFGCVAQVPLSTLPLFFSPNNLTSFFWKNQVVDFLICLKRTLNTPSG